MFVTEGVRRGLVSKIVKGQLIIHNSTFFVIINPMMMMNDDGGVGVGLGNTVKGRGGSWVTVQPQAGVASPQGVSND